MASEKTDVMIWLENEIKIRDSEENQRYAQVLSDIGVDEMDDFKYIIDDLDDPNTCAWLKDDGKDFFDKNPGIKKGKLRKITAIAKSKYGGGGSGGGDNGGSTKQQPASAKDEWATWTRIDVKKWINAVLNEQIGDLDGCLKYVDGDDLTGKKLLQMADSGKNSLGCSSKQGKYVIFGKLQEYQEEDDFPTRAQVAKLAASASASKGWEASQNDAADDFAKGGSEKYVKAKENSSVETKIN
eukprot:CAMPEP_0201591818 /NCGR_PEP_ID=MMETSP0190_2-20130828/189877_1 /ASSEMBLY_ACC=CAM_ASM_000263 /TAXON_ID=37353 /ORGANISM="Rosalina sp." /LENGTH=240 /DNA_ID=CAMNT_0048050301 /DNA_START=98 /DNA_END=819 /DNA_ORIENTATION=+